jgi:hypothetical protein
MSEITTTPFSSKCEILGELWLKYRGDYPELEDFLEYNDLGLPIAYAISNDIVKSTDLAKAFIDETFDLLLAGLDIDDTGWDNLDQLLALATGKLKPVD